VRKRETDVPNGNSVFNAGERDGDAGEEESKRGREPAVPRLSA